MIEQMDWRWIFVVPMIVGFVARFVTRPWRVFSVLCCVLAALIPLVDANVVGVREDPMALFVVAALLAVLGRFLPDIARGVWVGLGRTCMRTPFLLGLAVILGSLSPIGRELLTSLAVMAIMVWGIWIMIAGRPWWWQKKKKEK
ncbi:MAG: hypothetical protein HZA35_04055 [Parcubacteria group bacterium]|nr:hypothetical protein [Parcubacteria group bacterium]